MKTTTTTHTPPRPTAATTTARANMTTTAASLIAAAPTSWFLRGCPDAVAAPLRQALELLFEQSAQARTRLGRRLAKGRPRRLASRGLAPEQIWVMLQQHNEPFVSCAQGAVEELAAPWMLDWLAARPWTCGRTAQARSSRLRPAMT
jgi:hypothetical protein